MFEKNKTFIAIIIGAIIIAGAIYFSSQKGNISTNFQNSGIQGQPTADTSKKKNLEEIFSPEYEDKEIEETEIETTGTIDYSEADNFVGEYKTVKGKVDNLYYSKSSDTTFINFCPDYKTCSFCAVVFSSDKSKFDNLYNYDGKTVEITGLIKTYQGRPEIILNNPSQIKVVD